MGALKRFDVRWVFTQDARRAFVKRVGSFAAEDAPRLPELPIGSQLPLVGDLVCLDALPGGGLFEVGSRMWIYDESGEVVALQLMLGLAPG